MRYRTILIIPVLAMSWATALVDVYRPGRAAAGEKTTRQQVERTVSADSAVVLTACLGSGSLTVHAWDHNQVRARASDGLQIDLQRKTSDANAEPAAQLALVIKNAHSKDDGVCLPFGDIELDVPRLASVKLQTREASVTVSGVAKVNVVTQGGTVRVQSATSEVSVRSIGGDISVNDSTAMIRLHSIGGSIDVDGVRPHTTVDSLEAGTVGGDIMLRHVSHQNVRVNSVSGEVNFKSSLAPGGRFKFSSISGRLNLFLPTDSSFRISATLGRGALDTDFPFGSSSVDSRRNRSSIQHLEAVYGGGEALIDLSSLNGSIHLRKQ